MSRKPLEPLAITTFCDDIRYEVGGKHSLIGIYRDDLLLQGVTFPTTLPKLALSVTLVLHSSDPVLSMDIQISLPGEREDAPQYVAHLDTQMGPDTDASTDKRRYLNFHFILAPITFKEPGPIKVRVHQQNHVIKAGTLNVRSVDTKENPLFDLAGLPPTAGLLT
jgi:hypothetical protein